MKAVCNGKTIAVSNETQQVEGNKYFPPGSVNQEFLKRSTTLTKCLWKGTAIYYHLKVDGKINEDAAWYYPESSEAAAEIKDHVAFWKGVEVNNK